ncbi:MAG: nickel-dependent lactate racemase [Clostridia bacterium]|nr:nickel-dependent lactate racemase [Clostridia bacterium]
MKISLPYGNGQVSAEIPEENLLGVLEPKKVEVPDSQEVIQKALAEPLGSATLAKVAEGRKKAVIVVSDATRPVPTATLLPSLVTELNKAGITRDRINVLIALGAHRRATGEEINRILGGLAGRLNCFSNGDGGYVSYGFTSRGTPVEVSRLYAEADIRIATGSIELHRLAGFTGGAKAVCPGVASRRAIEHNHSLFKEPGVEGGKLAGNPVREDLEEFTRKVGLDFLLNVVLGPRGEILGAYAGDWVTAHRAGCRLAEELHRIQVKELADIVVVSAGGYPKDTTVYQAVKPMLYALQAVKPGGIVIVAAQCPEGLGDQVFEQWIREANSPEELEAKLADKFVLGGHKTASITQAVKKAKIIWVSELAEETVRKLYFQAVSSLQEAVDAALAQSGPGAAKVWVMV